MANNRMFLHCSVCGDQKMIAKYYPSTGWYFECLPDHPSAVTIEEPGQLEDKLDELYASTRAGSAESFASWLARHQHDGDELWGAYHFKLVFET